MNAQTQTLAPNKADISAHLYALFDPSFVQAYPDAWIEIAYGYALTGGEVNAAQNFSVFQLQDAAKFAEAKNRAGYNIYVGPAIRQGSRPATGRAVDRHVGPSSTVRGTRSVFRHLEGARPGAGHDRYHGPRAASASASLLQAGRRRFAREAEGIA